MKKVLSIIALLLALLMIMASCTPDGSETETTSEETTSSVVENENEGIVKTDYTALVEKWMQYVEYSDGKSDDIFVSWEDLSDITVNETCIRNGVWVLTWEEEEFTKILEESTSEEEIPNEESTEEDLGGEEEETTEAPEPVKVLETKTLNIYNLKTEKLFKTYVSYLPEFTIEGFVDSSYVIEDYVKYDLETMLPDGIIGIKKTFFVLKDDYVPTPETEPSIADCELAYRYSYYDVNGDAIVEDSYRQIIWRPLQIVSGQDADLDDPRYLIDTDEKTFLMGANGEILKEFALGQEYNIPVYDGEGYTLGGNGYAYLEFNGYRYIITEAQPVMQTIGDLVMYTVPGMSVKILDENFKMLAEYESNPYHVSGYAILDNGSFYVCEYQTVFGADAAYDFEMADIKFDAVHKIVDPVGKKVETKEMDFVLQSLYNNTTESIKSYTSVATVGGVNPDTMVSFMNTCKIADGYLLAQIKKYDAEKVLSDKTVYAVLDQSLNVVTELPSIIPNQFGYPYYVNESTMVVPTRTTENKSINYTVNVKDGSVAIYPNTNDINGLLEFADKIDGGYYLNNKIYNEKWVEVCDFVEENYTFEAIINGKIYYSCNESLYIEDEEESSEEEESSNENDYTVSVGSHYLYAATVSSDALSSKLICQGIDANIFGKYIVCRQNALAQDYSNIVVSKYLNLDGDLLVVSGEKKTETVSNSYGFASYVGYTHVTVLDVVDGVYHVEYKLVLAREDLEIYDMNQIDVDTIEEMFPLTKTYTTYHTFR